MPLRQQDPHLANVRLVKLTKHIRPHTGCESPQDDIVVACDLRRRVVTTTTRQLEAALAVGEEGDERLEDRLAAGLLAQRQLRRSFCGEPPQPSA